MWVLQGKRQKILAELSSGKHSDESEVRLKAKPSRALLLRLLERTGVKQIHLSAGLYATVPPKVRSALGQAGVQLIVFPARAGRPDKYGADKTGEARSLLERGQTAKEVSKKTGLPLTAVYYYKLKMGKKKEDSISALPDST